MKATGIVRRIDDLGRIVIPKEIRRSLRIRESEPIEIYTEKDGEVILRKFSPIKELSAYAQEYVETLAKRTHSIACVSDRDQIVAVAGKLKEDFNRQPISKALEKAMEKRKMVSAKRGEHTFVEPLAKEKESICHEVIATIICQGDVIGSVMLLSMEEKWQIDEAKETAVMIAADYLGGILEA